MLVCRTEYLHHGCKPPIVHRDVKTSNILLSESMEAKIADFGLSKVIPSDSLSHMTSVVGTTGYLDPECVLLGECHWNIKPSAKETLISADISFPWFQEYKA